MHYYTSMSLTPVRVESHRELKGFGHHKQCSIFAKGRKPFEVIQQLRFCMLLRDSMMFKEMAFQTPYGI